MKRLLILLVLLLTIFIGSIYAQWDIQKWDVSDWDQAGVYYVTLGSGGGVYSFKIIDGENISVSHSGWTINNITLYDGGFDIYASVTLNNCIGFDETNNVLDIANGVTVTINNSLFSSSEAQAEAKGGTVTETSTFWSSDPLFLDASNGDFHTLSSSPCRNTGTRIWDFNYDKDGNRIKGTKPDIGAYESQKENHYEQILNLY